MDHEISFNCLRVIISWNKLWLAQILAWEAWNPWYSIIVITINSIYGIIIENIRVEFHCYDIVCAIYHDVILVTTQFNTLPSIWLSVHVTAHILYYIINYYTTSFDCVPTQTCFIHLTLAGVVPVWSMLTISFLTRTLCYGVCMHGSQEGQISTTSTDSHDDYMDCSEMVCSREGDQCGIGVQITVQASCKLGES